MSNEEHLFENAIIALENKESYDKWLEIETKSYNTLGVSEEVIEVIWHLAIYTVYTHNPALEYDYNSKAIPIGWIKEYLVKLHKEGEEERDYVINELGGYEPVYKYIYETGIEKMIKDWEKENDSNNTL